MLFEESNESPLFESVDLVNANSRRKEEIPTGNLSELRRRDVLVLSASACLRDDACSLELFNASQLSSRSSSSSSSCNKEGN